jgi:hypothetical protein
MLHPCDLGFCFECGSERIFWCDFCFVCLACGSAWNAQGVLISSISSVEDFNL